MGRRPVAVDQLVEYIELRIIAGEYPSAAPLPSVRRLAGKFGLSYGTAYRTLEKLCTAGLLSRREPHGFFVAEPSRRQRHPGRITVFLEPSRYHFGDGLSLVHRTLLTARDLLNAAGFELELRDLYCSQAGAEAIRAAGRECDGLMLMNSYDHHITELELPVPAVGLLMQNSFNGLVSTVNPDVFDLVRIAVGYFMRKGVGRVTVLSSPRPLYHNRGRIFAQAWTDIGGRVNFIDTLPDDLSGQSENGFFFTSDDRLNNASADYRERHGRRLETEFTVLGVDGKSRINPDYPRFPSIAVDWTAAGRFMAEELLRRLAAPGTEARHIGLCSRLIND